MQNFGARMGAKIAAGKFYLPAAGPAKGRALRRPRPHFRLNIK